MILRSSFGTRVAGRKQAPNFAATLLCEANSMLAYEEMRRASIFFIVLYEAFCCRLECAGIQISMLWLELEPPAKIHPISMLRMQVRPCCFHEDSELCVHLFLCKVASLMFDHSPCNDGHTSEAGICS
ncbi:hypothetical protein GOP47_0027117 [Adiantum capillus-veneris]|nr:hypothetical protein GOP47_0027117 [Adiantum capillus-veneris]